MDSGVGSKMVIARFITDKGVETNLDVQLSSYKINFLRPSLKDLQKNTNILLTKHVEATRAAAELRKQSEKAVKHKLSQHGLSANSKKNRKVKMEK